MQAALDGGEAENPVQKALASWNQQLQRLLDKSSPHVLQRWLGLLALALLYGVRVFLLRGFYIVTYGLGIYNLNLLLGFITPQVDPELEEGPELPTKLDQEFKPFVRRLPEFKFW
jgi:Rer1 family